MARKWRHTDSTVLAPHRLVPAEVEAPAAAAQEALQSLQT